jgi:4-hydroxythreonine-4-phosphate dehydrogenase
MGDPAGISPELAAKVHALDEVRQAARLVIVGDKRVFDRGGEVAGLSTDIPVAAPGEETGISGDVVFVDLRHLDPDTVALGAATAEGGRFALANYRYALRMAADGRAQAVAFMPFNKQAMKLAHPPYEDEIGFSADVVGLEGPASEFNVLGRLWNARVTSHVPLSKVAGLITRERILRGLELTDSAMRAAGFERPRIAVAGLNPHAGDGGNFGREEIDVIAPAVEDAQRGGLAVEGPFPSDTVFLRARSGAFDAVLTMYHDQGQIAMKLLGFDQGVTLLGGFPFPIVTPAHGTAYDIAGRGTARVSAAREALLLGAAMAARQASRREERVAREA